ncbi:hypothetical protein ACFQGW_11735 [Xanthomonas theicola]
MEDFVAFPLPELSAVPRANLTLWSGAGRFATVGRSSDRLSNHGFTRSCHDGADSCELTDAEASCSSPCQPLGWTLLLLLLLLTEPDFIDSILFHS